MELPVPENSNSVLKITRFGDPILREPTRKLTVKEIQFDEIQGLIKNIRTTVEVEKAGVGLAAPQVGASVALSLIAIKPTPNRPDNERFESVIINPAYVGIGRRGGMWGGCISCGRGKDTLFGKALRYRTIKARWLDADGGEHDEQLEGFVAHVFQHETDHLSGILFVDWVRDPKTYMMADEYRKRIAQSGK